LAHRLPRAPSLFRFASGSLEQSPHIGPCPCLCPFPPPLRSRLSYETFSSFLGAIKELNAGKASRDSTLARARELFGGDNGDLYALFEGLLSRHLAA
jgi:hypothetical protein